MDDNAKHGIKEEHNRRNRIRNMKSGIVFAVTILLLCSVLSSIYLFVKVSELEDKMNYLLDHFTVSKNVEKKSTQQANDTEESAYLSYDTENNTELSKSQEDYALASSINMKDNLWNEGDERKVYLTFDDGPSSSTQQILDILNEKGVKASFFVVGKTDDAAKQLYKEIIDQGNTLGMHSYSHKYSVIYSSLDAFISDYSQLQNYLYDITGKECLYYRFPGGSSNHVSNTNMSEFIKYLNSQEITYFDWNVSSGDATNQEYTAQEVIENVMKDVVKYKTSVVLMHDGDTKQETVKALGPLIDKLREINAEILPIDENTTVIQHIAAASVEGQ